MNWPTFNFQGHNSEVGEGICFLLKNPSSWNNRTISVRPIEVWKCQGHSVRVKVTCRNYIWTVFQVVKLSYTCPLQLERGFQIFDSWSWSKGDVKTLTKVRLRAKKAPAPPPLGNFADISYLEENFKPHLLRDVCTLCSGALVSDSLLHMLL